MLVSMLPFWAAAQSSTIIDAALTLPPAEGPVVVSVAFDLQDIHSINDEAETFSFSGLLTLNWHDARQAFDPEETGIREKIYNGAYQFNKLAPIWFPQLIPVNTSGLHKSHGVMVRIQPNGDCMRSEMITVEARTKFDLRKFPHDSQKLDVIFGVMGFSADEVRLQAAGISGYQPDQYLRVSVPQWELMSIEMVENQISSENFSSVILQFPVQRKWFYVARLVVAPLLIICLLSWSVFWMDRSALGNRMSVSFVGILTAVAYQTKVGDILPQIAYLTRIHAFLAISFFLMCATALVNLAVGAYERKGQYDLAHRIDKSCRWAFPLLYASLLFLIVLFIGS